VDVRVFAGTFLSTNAIDAGPYRFRMSGQTGSQDYLYDNIFLGRSERDQILSQQFTETDGAFKSLSYAGQSSQWLAALNIKSSLGNMKLPINLYADIGTCAKDGISQSNILYDAGVCISLRKNMFEIYFPILMSQDFVDHTKIYGLKYPETIRFTLNLNLINPFDLVHNFKL
jgi:hypothetical protein